MFKRSVALIIVLSLCFSAASFAGKPVKLSNAQMQEVQGAVAPLILVAGAVAGSFAIACSVDLIAAQYDYFSNDPDQIEPVAKTGSAVVGMLNPATAAPTTVKILSGNGPSSEDLRAFNRWGKYTGDKNIEVMTKTENIAAGLTGGIGEIGAIGGKVLGASVKTGLGPVAKGAKGLDTLRPFLYGSAVKTAEIFGNTIAESTATCAYSGNKAGAPAYVSCVQDQLADKFSDPLTWTQIVCAGMARGESYNVLSGNQGAQLFSTSKLCESVANVVDLKDDVVQAKSSKKSTSSSSGKSSSDWIVDTSKPAGLKADFGIIEKFPGGNVIAKQESNGTLGYYYELPDAPTYTVGGQTYTGAYDAGGNPMCVANTTGTSGTKKKSSGSSSGGSDSSGGSSSPSGGSASTTTTAKTGSTGDSGKVGTMTTAVAQSAIAKASSGKLDSLTATERAYLSNN